MADRYICGQCGASRHIEEVVMASEIKDTIATCGHYCGFVAIRCKEHDNALQLARRAVTSHLRRVNQRDLENY